MLQHALSIVIVFTALFGSARASAQDTYVVHGTQIIDHHEHGRDPHGHHHDPHGYQHDHHHHHLEVERASPFRYGYQGFFSGALAGVSVGYLFARPHGIGSDDWRPLVLGAGIGALSGAAFGFSLGLLDDSGRYVARDMSVGVGFGGLLGATAGGLAAVASSEPEHILFGAAIGSLAGLGLGIVAGFIEGQVHSDDRQRRPSARLRVSPSSIAVAGTWLPAVAGRF